MGSSRRRGGGGGGGGGGGEKKDLFHVVHKVPAGDSPYVRAKHLQVTIFLSSSSYICVHQIKAPFCKNKSKHLSIHRI